MQHKIIAISGKMGNGKDAVAQALKRTLEDENNRVRIVHFGDLVKATCIWYYDWNREKDEAGRHLLQTVGTDIVRNTYDELYWARYVCTMLKLSKDHWDVAIIPDLRFDNELQKLFWTFGKENVKHIQVLARYDVDKWSKKAKSHVSEHALNYSKFIPDVIVHNNGKEVCAKDILDELFR